MDKTKNRLEELREKQERGETLTPSEQEEFQRMEQEENEEGKTPQTR